MRQFSENSRVMRHKVSSDWPSVLKVKTPRPANQRVRGNLRLHAELFISVHDPVDAGTLMMTNITTDRQRSRRWCFTLNNPSDVSADDPQQWPAVRFVIWQKEAGTLGTPHLQGFVVWEQAKSLASCKAACPRAHFEFSRGTVEQNVRYCSKCCDTCYAAKNTEDCENCKRLMGPWTRGTRPAPGKRNDLYDVQDMLDSGAPMREVARAYFPAFVKYHRGLEKYKLLITPPRHHRPEILVIIGTTGTGKSRFCKQQFPGAFWKSRNKWWDSYSGEDTVIWDEFYGWVPLSILLRVLDWYPLTSETKGGSVQQLAHRHIFTSNVHPRDWYKNVPRVRVKALERRVLEFGAVYKLVDDGLVCDEDEWWPTGARAPSQYGSLPDDNTNVNPYVGPFLSDLQI